MLVYVRAEASHGRREMGRSVLIIVISVCSTLALNFAAVAKDTGGGAKGGAATTTSSKPVTNKSAAQQNSKYNNVYLGMRKSGGDPKSAGKPF